MTLNYYCTNCKKDVIFRKGFLECDSCKCPIIMKYSPQAKYSCQ